MSNEVKHSIIWAVAAVLIVAAPAGCVMDENRRIASAVAGGADAFDTYCALASFKANGNACLVRAAVKDRKP